MIAGKISIKANNSLVTVTCPPKRSPAINVRLDLRKVVNVTRRGYKPE